MMHWGSTLQYRYMKAALWCSDGYDITHVRCSRGIFKCRSGWFLLRHWTSLSDPSCKYWHCVCTQHFPLQVPLSQTIVRLHLLVWDLVKTPETAGHPLTVCIINSVTALLGWLMVSELAAGYEVIVWNKRRSGAPAESQLNSHRWVMRLKRLSVNLKADVSLKQSGYDRFIKKNSMFFIICLHQFFLLQCEM